MSIIVRASAAAGGLGAGMLATIPLGEWLVRWLFDVLGRAVWRAVVAEEPRADLSGIETLFAVAGQGILGFVLAVFVAVMLTLPVYVVVPVVTMTVALRLFGADRIGSTLGWTLVAGAVLVVAMLVLTTTIEFRLATWGMLLLGAVAAFVGRLVTELPTGADANAPAR